MCRTRYAAVAVSWRTSFCNIALLLVFVLIMAVGATPVSADELAVVANPRSGIDTLSHDEVINIFMGRARQLSSGITAQPIDLPATQAEKTNFYRLLVNKDLAEINSYWARLHFSGRIHPPMVAKNTANVIEIVASTPGAIGYINQSMVTTAVKQVFELGTQQYEHELAP